MDAEERDKRMHTWRVFLVNGQVVDVRAWRMDKTDEAVTFTVGGSFMDFRVAFFRIDQVAGIQHIEGYFTVTDE